jgi:hypothetical protein
MAVKNRTYDVFISRTLEDAEWAEQIAEACRASGLVPFTGSEIPRGMTAADAIWEALSESRAVIVVVSRPVLSQSVAIEVGGARAWNKPIFALLTDSTLRPTSLGLTGTQLYAASRLEDVITAIKRSIGEFTDNNRAVLADLYSDTKASVDQLALEPGQLDQLVKRFRKITGKVVSGEQLLAELLRLRKQGKLHKDGKKGRSPATSPERR